MTDHDGLDLGKGATVTTAERVSFDRLLTLLGRPSSYREIGPAPGAPIDILAQRR